MNKITKSFAKPLTQLKIAEAQREKHHFKTSFGIAQGIAVFQTACQ